MLQIIQIVAGLVLVFGVVLMVVRAFNGYLSKSGLIAVGLALALVGCTLFWQVHYDSVATPAPRYTAAGAPLTILGVILLLAGGYAKPVSRQ